MALWLQSGDQSIGIDHGIVARDDLAHLMQACELSARAAAAMSEASDRAAAIMEGAAAQALQVIRDAERDGERLRTEAHARGLSDAAVQWAEELSARAIATHLSVQRSSERLAELVMLASQRVIETEDRQALYRRALRTVSQLTRDSKTLVLHVGSEDAVHARDTVAEIAAQVGITVPLEIKVDNRLLAGGCVFESDYGVIDASLGLQVDAVRAAIGRAARTALSRPDGPPPEPPESGDGP
jgi:type III secretion protein L